MCITTQLCTVLPVTCALRCPSRSFASRAWFATVSIGKPNRPAPGSLFRRLSLIPGPNPMEPIGTTEAGVEPRICPCPGAGRPTPLPGCPGPPTARFRWRTPQSPAQSTSLCSLRITGLAERRLECKKKICTRDPVNRLRAGWQNPTGTSVRGGPAGHLKTSNDLLPHVPEFDGQNYGTCSGIPGPEASNDQQRIDFGAGAIERHTADFSATRSPGSTCAALRVAAPCLLRRKYPHSETSAAIRTLAAPWTLPGEGVRFSGDRCRRPVPSTPAPVA